MQSIDQDIKEGRFKPVYLLYGEETYLIRQYKDKLLKAFVQPDDTMNFSVYEGEHINQKEVIDMAETLPFLAEKRVLLIINSGLFEKAAEELADYMQDIPEHVCFLFVEEKIDRRSKMFKNVQKCGSAIEFQKQSEETLKKWIAKRLRSEQKTITNEAYQLFIQKTGDQMENIDKELEKLICYCLDKDVIQAEDVEAITVEQITNRIFEMVDAIALHMQEKALDLYYDLLSLKEPPMRILALITRQFKVLLIVKSMFVQGFSNKEIAKKAGCPEWAVKKYISQAKAFSLDTLKAAIKDGLKSDEDIKSGNLNDRLAVELFIVQYSKE